MTTPRVSRYRYWISDVRRAVAENRVVQNLSVWRVGDVDRRLTALDPALAIEEVVADHAAAVIVRRAILRAERDLPLRVDERVALDHRVARAVPEENRRPCDLTGGRHDVPEDVVTDGPAAARVDLESARIRVARGSRVFEHRSLDQPLVDAAALAVRIRFHELTARINQADVLNSRRLRPGREHDRVVVDVAHGQVRDRDAR